MKLCFTAHSLKEVNSAEEGNKSDSFEEPSSDESDFDFDDESSNQSYVKSQTSQTISEKSNTFDNKIADQECDSKVTLPIIEESTIEEPIVSSAETYDSYLGDETGKYRKNHEQCDANVNNLSFWLVFFCRCESTNSIATSKWRSAYF